MNSTSRRKDGEVGASTLSMSIDVFCRAVISTWVSQGGREEAGCRGGRPAARSCEPCPRFGTGERPANQTPCRRMPSAVPWLRSRCPTPHSVEQSLVGPPRGRLAVNPNDALCISQTHLLEGRSENPVLGRLTVGEWMRFWRRPLGMRVKRVGGEWGGADLRAADLGSAQGLRLGRHKGSPAYGQRRQNCLR